MPVVFLCLKSGELLINVIFCRTIFKGIFRKGLQKSPFFLVTYEGCFNNCCLKGDLCRTLFRRIFQKGVEKWLFFILTYEGVFL